MLLCCWATGRLKYTQCRTIVPIVWEQLGQLFYIRQVSSNLPIALDNHGHRFVHEEMSKRRA